MGKILHITTKMIAVMLSMVMLISVLPMQGFAVYKSAMQETAINDEENRAETNLQEDQTNGDTEAVILAEDSEKREANVKYFRMSDGSMQAAQYAESVHFHKNGVWVDYDNTLTEVDADAEDNEGLSLLKSKDLTNQTADYAVRLSKKTNGKKFVRLEKDGYQISWYYLDAKKRTAKVIEAEDDGDPTTLEKLTSSVLYEDVFQATDLEYILHSGGIKENLLLQSAKAPTAFTATYKTNGLTPVAVDDKNVELRAADGTVVYCISAPYMEDATGEFSDSVMLSILAEKNNTFTLQIKLDADWLSAKERVFPVTVDPAIQTKQENSEMLSTFVDSKHPSTAHGKSANDMGSMYVGRNINEYGTARTYIKVNTLPDIGGVGSKVIDARLSVCKRNVYSTADIVQINAYQVTGNWNLNGLTYDNQPSHNSNVVDYMLFAADNKVQSGYQDNNGYSEFKTLEITDLVRGWYENTQSNYGIMLDTEATNTHKVWF